MWNLLFSVALANPTCEATWPARESGDPAQMEAAAAACLEVAEAPQWRAEGYDTQLMARFFAGDLHGAVEAGLLAVAAWEEHGGAQSTDAAWTRLQLAKVYGYLGDWQHTAEHAQACLGVVRSDPEQVETTLDAFATLAGAWYALGHVSEAYALELELLPLLGETYGPDHEEVLQLEASLVATESKVGNNLEALSRLVSLQARTADRPEDDELVLRLLQTEATLRYGMGDYGAGRRLSEEVVRRMEGSDSLRESALLADARINLAIVLADHGDLHAVDLARSAIGIIEAQLGPAAGQLISYYLTLANALNVAERFEEASEASLHALELAEALVAPDSPMLAHPLTIAAFQLKERDPERALALAERAVSLAGDPLGAAQAISVVGSCHEAAGRYAQAVDAQERSVLAYRDRLTEGHPMLAFDEGILARSLFLAGRQEEAVAMARGTLGVLGEHSERVMHLASVRERLGAVKRMRFTLDRYLAFGPDEPVAEAWGAGLRLKGLVMRSTRTPVETADESAQQARLREVRAAISQLTWSPTPDVEALAALTAEKESLEREIGVGEVSSTSVAALCAALAPDEVLVDVFEVDPNLVPMEPEGVLLAFVATGGEGCVDGLQRVELGESSALEVQVAAYRQAVERNTDPIAIRDAGLALRRAAWDPIAAVTGEAPVVHIAPDGPLVLVPWAGLPRDDGSFLVEHVRFSVQAIADDVLAPPDTPLGTTALVVGDVDYGGGMQTDTLLAMRAARCLSAELEPLPATALEATDVLRGLRRQRPRLDSVLLTGAEATVDNVRAELGSARVVHLATHGFFADEHCRSGLEGETSRVIGHNPLALAGVALAGANQPSAEDDGLWTAEEVSGLSLDHVELFVLSACESGLGVHRAGEGLLGMRQALRAAGARNVVSTLWSVPDGPTLELMKRFYAVWTSGRTSPAEALQRAQQQLLEEGRRAGDPAPANWAAFVVTGHQD